MKYLITASALGSAMLALTTPALAHTGHTGSVGALTGLSAGLLHPFTGLDHLLAALAIGYWAASSTSNKNRRALNPPLFLLLGLTGLGAIAALAGITAPALETGLALSLLILGLMVSFTSPRLQQIGLLTIALFAGLHGVAHGIALGTEAAGPAISFLAGVLIATALLYVLGAALSEATRKLQFASSAFGSVIALTGIALLIT